MTLSQAHRDYLLAAAITPEVLDASGIHTREKEPTGIVFPWNDGSFEEPLPQLRPDVPSLDEKGRPVKYRFPKDARMVLNRLRDSGDGSALICEGTKQQYSALSYAPEDFAVYGLSGCWNWTDADLSWALGRDVYVLFDGDVTTNKDVHKAATEFAEKLDLSGAASVKYVRTTARGTDGLDDVLARLPEDKRAQYLALWIEKALPKLPKAPATALASPYFDKQTGFQVLKATDALLEAQPAALTAERKVALYLGGSYHIDGTAFLSAVGRMLGDQFRPAWRAAMEEMTVGRLFEMGKVLPERSPYTKLNCANGMLDLRTLELSDHSPEFMSTVQVGVEWDPDAKAPTYERWLDMVCTQIEDLEEVAGTMLDPTRTPHKAAFLFGPSRSGKSTFLRLLQAIAGVENRTAVTLHDLSRDRFAAANVYGKILNSAADLSSAHVEDLSVFKMMTGEDPIHGNRKYGSQFTFTNQALFAFSANELPTVTESSRAYAERIKPFEFPFSFAGKENPALEARMLGEELPGILVRWVNAYRRVLERGGYQPTDERVRREFDTRSDRVAQWVADVCQITPASPGQTLPEHQCTGRRESARAFNQWAKNNHGHPMGERKIFERLSGIYGVAEVRSGRSKQRAFNLVVKDDPNSDLGFSPEQPRRTAEVALSEHPSHTTSPSAPGTALNDLVVGGEVEVHGKGASKVPLLPPLPDCSCEHASEQHNEHGCYSHLCPCRARRRTLSPAQEAALQELTDLRQEMEATAPVALGFDLETASAGQLFTGGHEGPFVRLAGVVEDDGDATVFKNPGFVIDGASHHADVIYGHNILGFDLLALAHHHGADYDALSAKAVDTMVLARLLDPPGAKGAMPWGARGYYGLDQVAKRLGHVGKSDDLKALADKWGGYDRIPVDNPEYNAYLRGDLDATRFVYEALTYEGVIYKGLSDYAKREMQVVALQNRMSLNGWAVDEQHLSGKVEREGAQRAAAIADLATFGVPLKAPDRAKLKLKREWPDECQSIAITDARVMARDRPEATVALGMARWEVGEAHKSPWSTKEGRPAIEAAFRAAGAEHLPRTKDGHVAISKEALGDKPWYDKNRGEAVPGLLQVYGDKPEVRRLVETLLLATGARVKYAEIQRYVVNGRVHAEIGAAQASGRWPMVHPSITTMGIRGGAKEERSVLVADQGHMLITCDHSQLDVRAVAALSQDPALIGMLQPDSPDFHTATSLTYFGTEDRRQDAKAINHGVNYGEGARAIAERNGLDVAMVASALQTRAEQFHVQAEWTEQVRAQAARGELLDNGFGRLMRCDPERAYTQAPALMGQGAARDIMCESLLRLVKVRPDVTPFLRAIVHDEIVLSVPADTVEEWSEELRAAMTWEWRGVPILCDVSKPAFRWSDCK